MSSEPNLSTPLHRGGRATSVYRAMALSGALLATGCSMNISERSACQSDDECRGDFGLGAVCMDDGYCEYAPANPRCQRTLPDDLGDDPMAHRDTLVVGVLMDRSLATHEARENAIMLAFSQANAQGGLDGRSFGLIMCTIEENPSFDSLSRREAAVDSARYLIDMLGVSAIIGPAASGDTQAVFEAIRDQDVLVISPSATSPALSDLEAGPFTNDEPGLLWRTAPPDSLQGQAIAADMTLPGEGRPAPVASVAMIHERGAYGEGLAEVFGSEFSGDFVALSYDDPAVLGEFVAMAGSMNVEEVAFASSQISDVVAFLNAATLTGYDNKTIFLTDSAANSDVLNQADPLRFPQVRGSRPAPLDQDNLVYSSFLASYLALFNDDAELYSFTAHSYDAAWLVIYGHAWALAREGEPSGHGIARGLRRLSDPTGVSLDVRPTNWSEIRSRLTAGESIDITGASGDLDYSPVTEETSSDIEIWRIQNREIVRADLWSPSGP